MSDISINLPPNLDVGQVVTVPLQVTEVTNFDACQFKIKVDPSQVEVLGFSSGRIGNTDIPVSIWNEVEPGEYIVVLNVPGVPGINGSGTLCNVELKALALGEIHVEITDGYMNSNTAETIESTWTGDVSNFDLYNQPIYNEPLTLWPVIGVLIAVIIRRYIPWKLTVTIRGRTIRI